jgi:ferritin
MLSDQMAKKINHQINREIFSSYLYLSMASCAQALGYKGSANWFYSQTQEELIHAKRMYDYIFSQGKRVILEDIEAPEKDFKSVLDMFEKTLAHEKNVTKMIHDLVEDAKKENDKETLVMLDWFVKEQEEEEETPSKIIEKMKSSGNDEKKLLEIDKELGKRNVNLLKS